MQQKTLRSVQSVVRPGGGPLSSDAAFSCYIAPAVRDAVRQDMKIALVDDPFDAELVVADATTADQLDEQRALYPLTPLVVFGRGAAPDEFTVEVTRSDLAREVERALDQALQVAERVRFLRQRARIKPIGSLEAFALAFAWTRAGWIRARIDGALTGGWGYPFAHRVDPMRGARDMTHIFARLVSRGALRAQPNEVALPCPDCASIRVLYRDCCNNCGSPHISPMPLVHHFTCGTQDLESTFLQASGRYVCPKCRRELRHFGLDYDKPGEILCCSQCDTKTSEPQANGRCLDCHAQFTADQAAKLTINDYELTEEGTKQLFTGTVDHQATADALADVFPMVPWPTFLVQLRTLRAIQRRHGLASQVLATGFNAQVAALLTLEEKASLIFHLGQRLRDVLRETDLITQQDGDILVLLGGNDAAQAGLTADRLRKAVSEAFDDRMAAAVRIDVHALDDFMTGQSGCGDGDD